MLFSESRVGVVGINADLPIVVCRRRSLSKCLLQNSK